jgi:hypothetical protein
VSPAAAQDSYIIYNTVYYDSPSHDSQMGLMHGTCSRYGPQYRLSGVQTPYSEESESGICTDGRFGPL